MDPIQGVDLSPFLGGDLIPGARVVGLGAFPRIGSGQATAGMLDLIQGSA
jgi:hypothetical protein